MEPENMHQIRNQLVYDILNRLDVDMYNLGYKWTDDHSWVCLLTSPRSPAHDLMYILNCAIYKPDTIGYDRV